MPSSSSTRFGAAVFQCKAKGLQVQRALRDWREDIARHPQGEIPDGWVCWAENRSPLWNDAGEVSPELELGKVHNLRVALRRLDGACVEGNRPFSFWKQIGQATQRRGYVAGRLLREGCLMPAVGGGLCALSNALYQLTLDCEMEVIERHAHSRVISGSATQVGRDATVAWNYIDLRFRSSLPFLIRASMTRDELVISFWGQEARQRQKQLVSISLVEKRPLLNALAHSCATCGVTSCFRHEEKSAQTYGKTAWIVDESWPEWERLFEVICTRDDVLLSSAKKGGTRSGVITRATLARRWAIRQAARTGGNVWKAQLEATQSVAKAMERAIPFDARHLIVSQSLLPYL